VLLSVAFELPPFKGSKLNEEKFPPYQAALSNEWEADEGRWASTADQDAAVKAVMAGVPAEAWQAPEPGCGEQVADAVHTMHATKAAFRLSLTREKWPRKFAQADQWRICSH
jgi:hypothetical protein